MIMIVGALWSRGLCLVGPLSVLLLFQATDAQQQRPEFMYLGGQSLFPTFEGWWQNEDGSFELFFGYMNYNWEQEFDIPIGPDNYLAFVEPGGLDDLERQAYDPEVADQGQPAHFYPRRTSFQFTVRAPEDFGDMEVVWTLTANGETNRTYGSLASVYSIDKQTISTEVGGAFGSLNSALRTNIPAELEVQGDKHREIGVGEPLKLVAFANDPDNLPARQEYRRRPQSLEELFRPIPGTNVHSGPGLRLSWIVYRGPSAHVSFDPVQMKTWMDTRLYANSPWSPPFVIPEPPSDGKWVTQVTFEEPGEYVLRAVASDGSLFTYENVMVTATR